MSPISRRTFLWLTGGSGIALAADQQRKFVNRLIPLVVPPENIPSGEWALFATTCRECPAGCGMHLWHRDGRVTKAEGNPEHPVNRGGLCPRGQSSLQGLYDPDRIKTVWHRPRGKQKQAASWNQALSEISARIAAGGRVAVVSSLQTGSLAEVLHQFARAFNSQPILFYEPFNHEPLKKAHAAAFGLPVVPEYRIERCQFVISFAADFLETWISPVSLARQFGDMRTWSGSGELSRMAYVGPRLSMTAANADTFIQVPPGHERLVAMAMLKAILDRGWARQDLSGIRPALNRVVAAAGQVPGVSEETILQLARRFVEARESVALAGPVGSSAPQAAETALVCALLNFAAGRIGTTVDFSRPHALTDCATEEELQQLFASLGPGDTLFIHDTNPVFSRPGAAAHLSRAGLVVVLGTMPDETAEVADWVLPIDSPLESWGDYEPSAGIHSLMQPTMAKLYDSRLAGDVLIDLARQAGRNLTRSGSAPGSGFEGWLAARWRDLHRTGGVTQPYAEFWTQALRSGGYWSKPAHPQTVKLGQDPVRLLTAPPPPSQEVSAIDLWAWGSIMFYDGRTANRGWIQEAPDPVSFITWGNWIDLHPSTAKRLKLHQDELAELSGEGGKVVAPVRITAEVAENVAAIAFGQGHTAMGSNARGIGTNVYQLLGGPHKGTPFQRCQIRKAGGVREYDPTYTAPTREQQHRHIVRWTPLSELQQMKMSDSEELNMPLPEGYTKDKDFYPKREYLTHRWGMVVDMQRCIGCGACAVACYAENNIGVMGKKQVARQLEMAWLRVVPYRKPDSPGMRYSWLPLLCQHCDQAPCEPVCPVFAAMHNEEGLNAQIYNRCIGTRYCNNNCPYKVRRFNWLNITWRKPLDMQLNPEVTVRCRGVMEKCTFCVQRIRNAEHRAIREGRTVRDGEIQPACAQSCPTRVYTFGDLLDPHSRVSQIIKSDPRRYQVLRELNTKPAVIYLQRIDNDVEA